MYLKFLDLLALGIVYVICEINVNYSNTPRLITFADLEYNTSLLLHKCLIFTTGDRFVYDYSRYYTQYFALKRCTLYLLPIFVFPANNRMCLAGNSFVVFFEDGLYAHRIGNDHLNFMHCDVKLVNLLLYRKLRLLLTLIRGLVHYCIKFSFNIK